MARPKSNRQVARVSVSFDANDYQELRALADQNDVSAAWIVRRAVTRLLDEQRANRSASAVLTRSMHGGAGRRVL